MAVSVMSYADCVRVSDTRGRQGKANFYSPDEQRQGILEAAGREGVEVVLTEPDPPTRLAAVRRHVAPSQRRRLIIALRVERILLKP